MRLNIQYLALRRENRGPHAVSCGLFVLVLGLLAGCNVSGQMGQDSASVHFTPLRTRSVVPQVIADPGAPSEDGVDEIKAIVSDFEQGLSPEQAAGVEDAPGPNMADLEARFIQRGRYLDLVGIYQNMIGSKTGETPESAGLAATVDRRLVRAYLNLGQRHLARATLDEMLATRGDDPTSWFLNAAYFIPDAPTNPDAAARVVANWQKALDIDPDFEGFDQPGVPGIRQQLEILRQRTPEAKISEAMAELHGKMNAGAVENQAQAGDETSEAPVVAQVVAPQEAPTPPVVGTPPPAQELAQVPAPAPSVPDAPARSKVDDNRERTPYLVAYGNMALAQEKYAEAERYFNQVLAREPGHFGAQFGLIRAGWPDEARRAALAADLRKLAAREDLTAREQAEVGKFVYFDLGDPSLALKLWRAVEKRDPKMAKAMGLEALIKDAVARGL